MDFSREAGNCLLSLTLSCFTKWVTLPQGGKKGGKLQAKTVKKFVWVKRDLLRLLCPLSCCCAAPIAQLLVTVNRMLGREISLHADPWRWHAAGWHSLGFLTWIFRGGIRIAEGLQQPGTLLQFRPQSNWANIAVTMTACYFGILSLYLYKTFPGKK